MITLYGPDAALRVKSTVYLPTSVMSNRVIINIQMGTFIMNVDQALFVILLLVNNTLDLFTPLTIGTPATPPTIEADGPATKSQPPAQATDPVHGVLQCAELLISSPQPSNETDVEQMELGVPFVHMRDLEVRADCDAVELFVYSLPTSKDLRSRFHRDDNQQLLSVLVHSIVMQITEQEEKRIEVSVGDGSIRFGQGNEEYVLLQQSNSGDRNAEGHPIAEILLTSEKTEITLASWYLDVQSMILLNYIHSVICVMNMMPLDRVVALMQSEKSPRVESNQDSHIQISVLHPMIKLLLSNDMKEVMYVSMDGMQLTMSSLSISAGITTMRLSIVCSGTHEFIVCKELSGSFGVSFTEDGCIDLSISTCELQLWPHVLITLQNTLDMISTTESDSTLFFQVIDAVQTIASHPFIVQFQSSSSQSPSAPRSFLNHSIHMESFVFSIFCDDSESRPPILQLDIREVVGSAYLQKQLVANFSIVGLELNSSNTAFFSMKYGKYHGFFVDIGTNRCLY